MKTRILEYIFSKYTNKYKYFVIFSLVIITALLITIAYKNDNVALDTKKNTTINTSDLTSIKQFLLSKIISPFTNIEYKSNSIKYILYK